MEEMRERGPKRHKRIGKNSLEKIARGTPVLYKKKKKSGNTQDWEAFKAIEGEMKRTGKKYEEKQIRLWNKGLLAASKEQVLKIAKKMTTEEEERTDGGTKTKNSI